MPAFPARPLDRVLLLLGAALLLATVVIGAINLGDAGGQDAAASEDTKAVATQKVDIKDFKYLPPVIKVKAGTKVTWTNEDRAQHTASSPTGADVETDTIRTGESKTITLNKPGTYDYICDFHPYMKGKVIVE